MSEQENQKKSFKDTLNLPQTDFPIRANYKEEDASLIERWKVENLFTKAFEQNNGEEKFILHDGPPYANGHTHIGHAYNKILKDIIGKSRRMTGKHVPITPGWDCHGLPIEFAVKKENAALQGAALKKECREYASKWIEIQKYEFKKLGVLMDWDNPYLTMSKAYEADILRAFGLLVEKGYIERKNKTVPWCPTCQTVLASAEIEYQDRKDPSIYVLFELNNDIAEKMFPALDDKPISFLVWTTTPWTLPLNRAVLLKPNTEYVVLETPENYIIVGKVLADKIAQLLSCEKIIRAEFNADVMKAEKAHAQHPLIDGYEVPVLTDDSVLTDDGTACVHSAPGAGPVDYEVGIKNNLEVYSPVTASGQYDTTILPQELSGMAVASGQGWVITKLLERNNLLFKASIKHSYPHCWRCRGGLIFRATKQWFCDLSKNNLKEEAVESIARIEMLPKVAHNRFEATIEGRLEWCLSRQREWGVPIPALICDGCDYTMITKEFIDEVADQVELAGIEYWDTVQPTTLRTAGNVCPRCNNASFRKETDILDVWFDSGVSHYAVLKKNKNLAYPASVYLEGKDQHRGWFQSSLLTSMIIEKRPCTKTIVTHGFTVDEQGKKMSKSLGNVVSPQQMIERLGTDGLRLWAASVDISGDAVVSDVLLKNVQEVLRKIRNTCRFLLSNMYDFDYEKDALAFEKLKAIDAYALQELRDVYEETLNAYEQYNFTRIFHLLSSYCAVNLSAFYLDIIKDRLYVEKYNGFERRSAQTACYVILDTLTKMMAPILSFTAEQLSDNYQKNKTTSIHLQQFSAMPVEKNTDNNKHWDLLKEMRSALLKCIEVQREKQLIKHSLEARVSLFIDSSIMPISDIKTFFSHLLYESQQDFLKEFLIVSQVDVCSTKDGLAETEIKGLWARVDHAHGEKCPRCWQWSVTNDQDKLCHRCFNVINGVTT